MRRPGRVTACGEAYEALARGWGRGGRVQAAMKAAGNEGGCFVQEGRGEHPDAAN